MKEQKRALMPTPEANPVAPALAVTLPGLSAHPIQLSFQHADFAEAEFRLGTPLLGLPSAEFWKRSAPAYQTKVLLYVGLLHQFPNLRFEDLRSHLTFRNAAEVEAVVAEAFASALPEILGTGKEADAPGDGEVPFDPGSNGGSNDGPAPDTTSGSPTPSSGL